jgi:DNA invertase Pin-like site-specific DNA recombinase
VSDEDKQSPERSFAMQRQRIQELLVEPSGLPFIHEYRDMLTGTSPNRKDYQQLLKDAEAGRFTHLGLYRADRFGRNRLEGLFATTKLIDLGIKIRMSNMPGLMPETPDGDFLYYLQMGLAQREVDVLKQRTRDGMEAKLRSGGWPHKAPDGYINNERQVSSNKYERWVEKDPNFNHVIREAWVLLLTGRYTLDQICDELASRGYTRASGSPWAWTNKRTGRRCTARNRIHNIFHNPFYAGWVVSERFGIRMGEVRGKWEPTVTTEEYEKGLEILLKNGANKSRFKKKFYLLRNILWVKIREKHYKLYGSTPTGRSKSYSYYITHAKLDGSCIRISCSVIEGQIQDWLHSIVIDPDLLPDIREIYSKEIKNFLHANQENMVEELQKRLSQVQEEEARLARLMITGRISEKTYDRLRAEWQTNIRKISIKIANAQRETKLHLDDLDTALVLLSKAYDLYQRLKSKQRGLLLQTLARKIIVNPEGEIIDHKLQSPFMYLHNLSIDQGIEGNHLDSNNIEMLKFEKRENLVELKLE